MLERKERKRKHANLWPICGGPALTLRVLLRLRLLLRLRDVSLCAEGRLNSSLVFGVQGKETLFSIAAFVRHGGKKQRRRIALRGKWAANLKKGLRDRY